MIRALRNKNFWIEINYLGLFIDVGRDLFWILFLVGVRNADLWCFDLNREYQRSLTSSLLKSITREIIKLAFKTEI